MRGDLINAGVYSEDIMTYKGLRALNIGISWGCGVGFGIAGVFKVFDPRVLAFCGGWDAGKVFADPVSSN